MCKINNDHFAIRIYTRCIVKVIAIATGLHSSPNFATLVHFVHLTCGHSFSSLAYKSSTSFDCVVTNNRKHLQPQPHIVSNPDGIGKRDENSDVSQICNEHGKRSKSTMPRSEVLVDLKVDTSNMKICTKCYEKSTWSRGRGNSITFPYVLRIEPGLTIHAKVCAAHWLFRDELNVNMKWRLGAHTQAHPVIITFQNVGLNRHNSDPNPCHKFCKHSPLPPCLGRGPEAR